MRDAFVDEVLKIAREDPRIVLLSGDIGNRMFDKFKQEFPDRFINCGVAEANMISTAAGMAMTGLIPIVYTIASFLTYRPFEQIRIDIAYHRLPVILVGVGGGLSYASNGPTHHATEDLAAMRSIPEMTLVAAADANEVRGGLRQLVEKEEPAYLRIGKKGEPLVYNTLPDRWKIGKFQLIQDHPNASITLLAQGTVVAEVLRAAEMVFRKKGEMLLRVFNVHTLRPFDTDKLQEIAENSDWIVTIEEHCKQGGLGSAVAEYLSENVDRMSCGLKRIGLNDSFFRRTTNTLDARHQSGLTAEQLASSVLDMLNNERRT